MFYTYRITRKYASIAAVRTNRAIPQENREVLGEVVAPRIADALREASHLFHVGALLLSAERIDSWRIPAVDRGECSLTQAIRLGLPYVNSTGEGLAEFVLRQGQAIETLGMTPKEVAYDEQWGRDRHIPEKKWEMDQGDYPQPPSEKYAEPFDPGYIPVDDYSSSPSRYDCYNCYDQGCSRCMEVRFD